MKRQRYTVSVSAADSLDITLRVVLAYDAADARRYYERRGYEVVKVERGDYRKMTQRPTGARPNPAAIREAIDFLGIKFPVDVKVLSNQGGAQGRHRARPTGGNVWTRGSRIFNAETATGWVHLITVKNWLTVEQMGQTLWHELSHAMQFERDALVPGRDGSSALRAWNALYSDGTSYDHKPLEVEARKYEQHNDELPLAR